MAKVPLIPGLLNIVLEETNCWPLFRTMAVLHILPACCETDGGSNPFLPWANLGRLFLLWLIIFGVFNLADEQARIVVGLESWFCDTKLGANCIKSRGATWLSWDAAPGSWTSVNFEIGNEALFPSLKFSRWLFHISCLSVAWQWSILETPVPQCAHGAIESQT